MGLLMFSSKYLGQLAQSTHWKTGILVAEKDPSLTPQEHLPTHGYPKLFYHLKEGTNRYTFRHPKKFAILH